MSYETTEHLRRDLMQYCQSDNLEQVKIIFDKYLKEPCALDYCEITNNFCNMCFQQSFLASAMAHSKHSFNYICSLAGSNANFEIGKGRFFHILKNTENPDIIKSCIFTLNRYLKLDKAEINEFLEDNNVANRHLIEEVIEIHQVHDMLNKEIQPLYFDNIEEAPKKQVMKI